MSTDAKDQEKAAEVFREAIELLETQEFDYAVGGGLATDHWTGGAEHIADIDLVIRKDDSDRLLKTFASAGYRVSKTEHSWLHKAFKDDAVTLDLMFELKNGTKFDDALRDHRQQGEMFGATVYVMAPEDQVTSLAGAVDRQTIGQHWYSMIDIMANNDLDWDYLISRSEQVPFQMLSVIYYALSENVPVEKGVIERLAELAATKS
ncbi:MAG TPA: nucleotidyltransferase family protein [Actinomycetota bacterium]|nr:nucleotidyltransferase family protein [Actinomycetota bacterium]